MENKRKEIGICWHCGADSGLHKFETMNCPKNGMEEYREGKRQEWQKTVFEDSGIKQFEIKAVSNYDSLLEALKDCWKDSINTDNNCQMRPETTMKILAAIQKAEQ